MAQNTPGPWALYSPHPREQYVDHVEDDEDESFCIFRMIPGRQVSPEEAAANARLVVAAVNSAIQANPDNPIAAAEALPELLEIARNLVALFDELIALKVVVEKAMATTARTA